MKTTRRSLENICKRRLDSHSFDTYVSCHPKPCDDRALGGIPGVTLRPCEQQVDAIAPVRGMTPELASCPRDICIAARAFVSAVQSRLSVDGRSDTRAPSLASIPSAFHAAFLCALIAAIAMQSSLSAYGCCDTNAPLIQSTSTAVHTAPLCVLGGSRPYAAVPLQSSVAFRTVSLCAHLYRPLRIPRSRWSLITDNCTYVQPRRSSNLPPRKPRACDN